MKKVMTKIVTLALVGGLSICAAPFAVFAGEADAENAASEEQVTTRTYATTTNGNVMGYCENGVDSFYGIPYAKATRFHMPEAPDAWEGYKTCLMQGEVCPQNKTTMETFDFMAYSTEMVENEETMLNLNVWTTNLDNKDGELKPVIFWIHGGGYTTGGSLEKTLYDGANFAKNEDVVFISANHRLNVLGYFDLSAYGEEYANSGNLGIADLVFALEWVRDNAEYFGGDPNNVTIIGQSGGGSKVTTLMSTPAAQGLFHKAVVWSGGSVAVKQTTEDTQAKAAEVLDILGITEENIKDIETIDYTTLYAAYNEAGYSAGPTIDGDYIPTGTYEMSKDIPLLASNVLGEFTTNIGNQIFATATKELIESNDLSMMTEESVLASLTEKYGDADVAAQIIDAFKEAYPGHNVGEVLYINNRETGMSVMGLCEAMESYGGTVYTSIQAASYPFFGGIVPIHTAGDVPLWFSNVSKIPAWVSGETAKFEALSKQMSDALAAFARTGTPSTEELTWEPWTSETDAIMVFDNTNGVTSSMRYHHEDALFAAIPAGDSNS